MNTLEKLAEIRVMELKKYVLPSIVVYLKNSYGLEVSVNELATEALSLPIVESRNEPRVSTPLSSPQKTTKGCQFLMKNSRTRPNMPCGKTANANEYFCKKCTEKASFTTVVKEVSDILSISVAELTSGIGSSSTASSKNKNDGIAIRAPRVPEKRDKYTGAPEKAEKAEKPAKVEKSEKSEKVEEDDELVLSEISDMLGCFCYDDKTSVVYYYDDHSTEEVDPIAFGIYKAKENKIYRLSEQDKINLRKKGIEIGNYDDYDLGDKEVI